MAATDTKPATSPCVVFSLDEQLYGIRLSAVSLVVSAVEITRLPGAPEIVIGVINLGGRIIPVVNLRRRFRLPEHTLELTDQLIVASTARPGAGEDGGRILALVVDGVVGVRELSTREIDAETILPGLEHLEGVAKADEGLILIHDLGTFLSLGEEQALSETLREGSS
jgi:purine-binding chemotaxis protein CheW